jgi:uncharacterized membrane protein SpoIIM required for sporulation
MNRTERNTDQGLPFSYAIALDVVRESFLFILIAVFIFLVGIYLGAEKPTESYNNFVANSPVLETVHSFREKGNLAAVALLIFLNNSFLAVRAIWFSFLFGVYPVANALLGGKLIGSLLFAYTSSGITLIDLLKKLAPHGVIEVAALLLSSGIGIWCFHGLARKEFRKRFARGNRALLLLVLPALAIAAIIEAKSLG